MPSKNVEIVRAAHESWNRRDFDEKTRNVVVYSDQARNLTLNGEENFKHTGPRSGQKRSPTPASPTPATLTLGTPLSPSSPSKAPITGTFAGMPPTGRKMTLHYCEVTRFDKNGRTISGAGYYDLFSILTH